MCKQMSSGSYKFVTNKLLAIYIYVCLNSIWLWRVWLVVKVLWHINICRLSNAKFIFMQINTKISV